MSARFHASEPKTDPKLARLLEEAAQHVMTPKEISAQRESWVIGEMMMQHPEMTRDEASMRYRQMMAKLGYPQ